MPYYDMIFDLDSPGRWWLDPPRKRCGEDYNPWIFSEGRPIEDHEVAEGLVIPIEERGRPMDITFTHFDVPVLQPLVAELFSELAPDDVQLLPAVTDANENVFVLVITHTEDCFDRDRSNATYYDEESAKAVRKPWVVGQPEMVIQLVIDPTRTNGRDVFRIKDYEGPFVVSEKMYCEITKRGLSGVNFMPISAD